MGTKIINEWILDYQQKDKNSVWGQSNFLTDLSEWVNLLTFCGQSIQFHQPFGVGQFVWLTFLGHM